MERRSRIRSSAAIVAQGTGSLFIAEPASESSRLNTGLYIPIESERTRRDGARPTEKKYVKASADTGVITGAGWRRIRKNIVLSTQKDASLGHSFPMQFRPERLFGLIAVLHATGLAKFRGIIQIMPSRLKWFGCAPHVTQKHIGVQPERISSMSKMIEVKDGIEISQDTIVSALEAQGIKLEKKPVVHMVGCGLAYLTWDGAGLVKFYNLKDKAENQGQDDGAFYKHEILEMADIIRREQCK